MVKYKKASKLTDTERLRNESDFTLWSNFDTKLSKLYNRTRLFTFLPTLLGFTLLSVENSDTGVGIFITSGWLSSLLLWRHSSFST
jgi:hypothetical protein